MANPTMTGVLTHSYVTITFSEACYNTNGGSGALEATDFALTYTDNSDTGSSGAAITAISTTTNTALSGGETTLRLHITTTGIPAGTAAIEIKAATNAIYNAGGEAMADTQTTGSLTLNPFLYIYVSKAGNDSNSGLVATLPKLTLGGAKAITATGENKIIIGVGNYTETTQWADSGKYITILCDYDAAIFSGSSGDIIQTTSTDFGFNKIRQIDRMILAHSAASKGFFISAGSDYQAIILNYCILRAYSGNNTSFSHASTNYFPWKKVTLNNCSLDTGNLTITGAAINKGIVEFNYWDNITSGKTILFSTGSLSIVKFNNSSILVSGLFTGAPVNYTILNSTIKLSTSSTKFLANSPTIREGWKSLSTSLIKDCTLLDSTGSNLDINTYQYFNDGYATDGITSIVTSIYRVDMIYHTLHQCKVLLDNINSNSKRILLVCGGTILDGDTETYNSKDILYYNGYSADFASSYQQFIIKLNGLAVSTEYNLTLDYKKSINSSNEGYATRFGILKGSQIAKDDLYTTPANALTYADYTSADHTYDTWYAKTLTFTTTSDSNDEYYLVWYVKGNITNHKITKPVLALHV